MNTGFSEFLCRTCLLQLSEDALDTSKHDIYLNSDLQKKFCVVTNQIAEVSDGLPKYLCQECFQKVVQFHEFHKMCIESLERLGQMQRKFALNKGKTNSEDDLLEQHNKELLSAETDHAICEISCDKLHAKNLTDEYSDADELPLVVLIGAEGRTAQKTNKTTITGTAPNLKRAKRGRTSDNKYLNKIKQENKITALTESLIDIAKQNKTNPPRPEITFSSGDSSSDSNDDDDWLQTTKASSKKAKIEDNLKLNTPKKSMVQCTKCSLQFTGYRNMELHHQSEHAGQKIYSCSFVGCEKGYNSLDTLKEHQNMHEGLKYSCEFEGCNKQFFAQKSLKLHFRNSHTDYKPTAANEQLEAHVCHICDYVGTNKYNLKLHMYRHTDPADYPLVCSIENCGKRFIHGKTLKEHMLRHNADKWQEYVKIKKIKQQQNADNFFKNENRRQQKCHVKCTKCCMPFTSYRTMETHHQSQHAGQKVYQCSYENCKKGYNSIDTLKEHLNVHEGLNYKCEFDGCNKVFNTHKAYKGHYRNTHTDYKPPTPTAQCEEIHICEICGYSGSNKYNLKCHMYSHMEPAQYPHACTIEGCGRRFIRRKTLNEHLLRHNGVRKFVCSDCSFAFTTKNELQLHSRKVHSSGGKIACSFCGFMSMNEYSLKRHIRVMHEKPKTGV